MSNNPQPEETFYAGYFNRATSSNLSIAISEKALCALSSSQD